MPEKKTNKVESNFFFLRRGKQKGYFLATILVFALVIIIITTTLIYITINQKKHFQASREKASARQVAEAGINYYLWHLTKNKEDYTDGTGHAGPYVHDYQDSSKKTVGTYSLEITPPQTGENYATVTSTGQLTGSPEVKVIEARLGIPSFARYALLSTGALWFGPEENSYGPVHSNVGIRHQGEAWDGIITASNETYYCTIATCGYQGWYPGVWCDDPSCSKLHSGYSFPVPSIDYNKITADLAQIKTDAQANGLYFGASGSKGYHIVLNQTNFRLYRVTDTKCAAQRTCYVHTQAGDQRVADDINAETLLGTYNFPNNGIVFVEDNFWIQGQINNAQLTFAAARFPDTSSTNASIVINNNLLYTNYDGTDKIGLIAQKFITLPKISPNYLEIDAAMISQHGYVEWHNYPNTIYQRIKVHGAMATNGGLAWSWVEGGGPPVVVKSGYRETITEYDDYLTFGPPPSFPTTGAYAILFWEEKP
jgi:type II secretory pathway pseudopilin PulG